MATTGFWPVKGRLKDVLDYAENPDKTIDRRYLDDDLAQALRYVENPEKTDQQMYVSAINCRVEDAYSQMQETKRRYGKEGRNVAYHGYQSFRPGEVTPEECHQIGLETAREMRNDPDVQFHIIGDGVYKKKLQEKAEAYGLANVAFQPMQPPELAPLIYAAADVNVIPLRKDIYRTALPSKTATCLACARPIIFAVGPESRFAQTAAEAAGCRVTEPDRPEQLAEAIRAVRSEGSVAGDGAFFRARFSRTANSRRYADIITGEDPNTH